MVPENISIEHIELFLLVLTRISVIIAFLPVFGSESVPQAFKIGFSVVLTVIITPLLPVQPLSAYTNFLSFCLLILIQIFIGLMIGFATLFLFAAIQFAGKMIDNQIGLALAEIIDPFTNAPSSITGQLKTLLFTIFFLLINGHYFFILAIQKSFESIPVGAKITISAGMSALFTRMSSDVFSVCIQFAAPILVTLFLIELALGVIARTLPQMNIFYIGTPVKLIVGLLSIGIVLPELLQLFKRMVTSMTHDIWTLLFLMS